MKVDKILGLIAVTCALTVFGCASVDNSADLDKLAAETLHRSFTDRGIAKVDRLNQDANNLACSEADASGKPLDEKTAKALQVASMKTIHWPADGKFIGNWREGEKIAQNGRGMTWNDKPGAANGGNCYNCHQIAKEELSFGTIGPSLYHYGKLRGVQDPASPTAKPVVEYTWGKLWNSQAYQACSLMPRVGHSGILNEQQLRDVMALLLDPQSPVNR